MKEKSISIMAKHRKLVILISVIAIAILGSMIMNFFDNRPIKFEDFESVQQGQSFFEKNYATGSRVENLISDFINAGGTCTSLSLNKEKESIYKAIFRCTYNSRWSSVSRLFVEDILVIYSGFNDEIIQVVFNQGYVGP